MTRRRTARPSIEGLEPRWTPSAGPAAAAVSTPRPRNLPIQVLSNRRYEASHGRFETMDVIMPQGRKPEGGWPLVVAFPGGGWRKADRPVLTAQLGALAQRGYVVAVPDVAYASSKLGTRVWPLNFEDARSAVRWFRSHSKQYKINPGKVAALGQSAGGHLASLLGSYPDDPIGDDGLPAVGKAAQDRPRVSARVQAVVNMYGPTDLNELAKAGGLALSFLQTFLGGNPDQVPGRYANASPVAHVSSDDPPFLMMIGAKDALITPRSQSAMIAALRADGVPTKVITVNAAHGFYLTGSRPSSTLGQAADFLDKALNRQGEGIG